MYDVKLFLLNIVNTTIKRHDLVRTVNFVIIPNTEGILKF